MLIIVILSIAVLAFDFHHYFNVETFKTHQKSLYGFILHNLFLSIIIYVVTYVSVVVLSIPGATFMTLVGGFLFGQWMGTCMVVFSATLGASLLFLSAKMASADLLSKKVGSLSKKMQDGFLENAFSYLLTLRLIPLFPFFAVNLAAALFQIPFRTFFIGTFLGIVPGTFVYVSMGVALREVIQKPSFSLKVILEPKILLAFIGLGVLSLLPVFYKKLKKDDS